VETLKKIWAFIKKISWKWWIVIAIAIIVIWQLLTGAAYSRKLYNMILDELRADQSDIVEQMEERELWYEQEISNITKQLDQIKKDKAALLKEKAKSDAEIARLEGRIDKLEDEIGRIVISDNPTIVIDDLRKRFPSIKLR